MSENPSKVWQILEIASKGATHQSRFLRNPFIKAAVAAYDELRFNHDLIRFLSGYLVDFALFREKEGKDTGPELLIQEAMKRGESFLSYGYEQDSRGFVVESSNLELLMHELYDDDRHGLYAKPKETAPHNEAELNQWCRDSIAANSKAAAEFRAGKESALNALKGPVMKLAKGKVPPKTVDGVLRLLLAGSGA